MPLNLRNVNGFYRSACLCFVSLAFCICAIAQDSIQPIQLDSIVVRAFDRASRLRDVPAAVNFLNRTTLERFGTASVVEAVNTTPGVRMEERSPGSYRFAIRGSALRSPFGVRNIKVYYNDLPLTDPSGQTYLNSLGNYDYGSMEIIKGPGSSFYGAGTGGVLLINSMTEDSETQLSAENTTGSYGLLNSYAAVTTASGSSQNRISYQHQQSNGFRRQSALNRNVVNWNGTFNVGEKNRLNTTFLYSDLFYETPGALTLAEYTNNPKDARPGAGGFPGAEQAQAAIYQQSFLAGASYTQTLNEQLQNKTVVYGAFTKLHNPAIRNYGSNSEPHAGARTVFSWNPHLQRASVTVNLGAEWQQGFASFSTLKNKAGQPDSLQIYNEVNNRQGFLFTNVLFEMNDWILEAGASINQYKIRFQQSFPTPLAAQKRTFSNELAPRFALLRKLKRFDVYSSISKGFSSPTTAEAVPTGSPVNLDLNAEHGITIDLGLRGNLFRTLYADVNLFRFVLKNAIVQRRDAAGGDYYTNAGETRQYGLEASLRQPLFVTHPGFKSSVWASYTWHQFHYKSFKQLTNDFSGNALPGVAPHTVAAGFDMSYSRFIAAITYYYSSKLPLNDANDAYLKSYHLAGARIGYALPFSRRLKSNLAAGVNNLFDEKYSLGSDINAAGGRYYNAAPERNFYVSVSFQWLRKKEGR